MKINIARGHKPNLIKADVNIVIDVIRAFTCAHIAFSRGVQKILLVRDVAHAMKLKEEHPEYVLAGEIKGIGIEGFELDNSPYRFAHYDFLGRTLVQKTTNGVEATLNALDAEHVLVTGFSNAKATALAIKRMAVQAPELCVNIIASHPIHDDDVACADYIKGLLLGRYQPTATEIATRIANSEAAKKFYDPERPEFDERDLAYCLQEAESRFIMKLNKHEHIPTLERVDI